MLGVAPDEDQGSNPVPSLSPICHPSLYAVFVGSSAAALENFMAQTVIWLEPGARPMLPILQLLVKGVDPLAPVRRLVQERGLVLLPLTDPDKVIPVFVQGDPFREGVGDY